MPSATAVAKMEGETMRANKSWENLAFGIQETVDAYLDKYRRLPVVSFDVAKPLLQSVALEGETLTVTYGLDIHFHLGEPERTDA